MIMYTTISRLSNVLCVALLIISTSCKDQNASEDGWWIQVKASADYICRGISPEKMIAFPCKDEVRPFFYGIEEVPFQELCLNVSVTNNSDSFYPEETNPNPVLCEAIEDYIYTYIRPGKPRPGTFVKVWHDPKTVNSGESVAGDVAPLLIYYSPDLLEDITISFVSSGVEKQFDLEKDVVVWEEEPLKGYIISAEGKVAGALSYKKENAIPVSEYLACHPIVNFDLVYCFNAFPFDLPVDGKFRVSYKVNGKELSYETISVRIY